ncbi:MAG: translation initiation factor IF-2 [Malacoplasma sp.]
MAKKNKNKNDIRSNIDLKSQFKEVQIGIKDGVFIFVGPLSIVEFSKQIQKPAATVIKHFFSQGLNCNLNTILSDVQMGELCLEFGFDFKKEIQIDEDNFLENLVETNNKDELITRPPIITIMGHVDHGKTTLLDVIRKTKVANSEVGGITQSIGAYQITWKNNLITFIDTPGHEAFSNMRARGANLTDIVVLVVAADDGIKPQTEEAIDHAIHAKVPIIVFINKMDKPGANVDKIISQLSDKNVLCEEWGGKTIVIKGSAINNEGINEILEAIILTSEILDLKANLNRVATGVTIESHLDKGLGPTATILVQNGTLIVGDYILIGEYHGKIRKIFNDCNLEITKATASLPVKICGINGVPHAGDKWIVTKDEKTLKDLAEKRKINSNRKKHLSNQIESIQEGSVNKDISIIIKADVGGSIDALKSVINTINFEGIKVNIIRASVGMISETDVNLAKTAKSLLIAFNLKVDSKVQEYANSLDIKIRTYFIIYEVKDAIEKFIKGGLEPVYVEEKMGELKVQQLWKHSSVGTIVGSKVISGEVQRNCLMRLIRNNETLFENKKISSLRTGKENINTASSGKECGFTVDGFSDFVIGDIVEVYKMVEKTDE